MKEIQNRVAQIIGQRDKVWEEYDQASATSKELITRFSHYQNGQENAKLIPPLTSENIPPYEVKAALNQLEITDDKIKQEQEKIEEYQQKIQELKVQSRNLVIWLSIGGCILIGTVILVIKNQSEDTQDSSQHKPVYVSQVKNNFKV